MTSVERGAKADPVDGFGAEGDKVRVQLRRKVAATVALGLALGAMGVGALGLASNATAAPTTAPSTYREPPAVTPATLAALEADGAHRTLTAPYVARARTSLARATELRNAGDATRATEAERAAATWVAAAEALSRADDWEHTASNVQLDTLDAGTRAERERALLEESLATVGRRKAELARLEREKSEGPARTTQTADVKDSADGGAASKGSHAARGSKDAGDDRDWAPNAATAAP